MSDMEKVLRQQRKRLEQIAKTKETMRKVRWKDGFPESRIAQYEKDLWELIKEEGLIHEMFDKHGL